MILIMIDGNEKRHCGGGFRVILKSTVWKCIEINLENLWILGLKGLKPTARLVFRLYVITVVSRESRNNAQVVISRIRRKRVKKIFKLNFALSVSPDPSDCSRGSKGCSLT